MKISTKTGDKGESGLFNGKRLAKHDLYFEVLGDLDELQAHLGWCKFGITKNFEKQFNEILGQIEQDIYVIMGTIGNEMIVPKDRRGIESSNLKFIETFIEKFEKEIGILNKFVLPGKNEASARFHIARTVCRRAERSVARLHEKIKVPNEILEYLNRLSDLLFLMACKA